MKKQLVYDIAMILGIIAIVFTLLFWVMSYSHPNKVKEALSTPLNFELPEYTTVAALIPKENGPALGDGAILSRPITELGGYRHYGVMFHGKVIHFNQHGLHLDSLGEFGKGDVIKVVKKGLTGDRLKDFQKHYKEITKKYKNSSYDALKNNCEHFVNELV